MARKAKGRQNKRAARLVPWRDEETAEMLACLEYGAENKLTVAECQQIIIKHLRSTFGRELSVKQIDGRLRYLWHTWGPDNGKDFQDVYRKGSSAFSGLVSDPDFKKLLDEAWDRMKTGPFLRTPRLLRSISRTPESLIVMGTCGQSTNLRSRKRQKSSSAQGIEYRNDLSPVPTKKERLSTPFIRDSDCSDSELSELSELSNISNVTFSHMEGVHNSKDRVLENDGNTTTTQAYLLKDRSILSSLPPQATELLHNKTQDIRYWRTRCEAAEFEKANLERAVTAARSVKNAMSHADKATELSELAFRERKEVKILQERLRRAETQLEFRTLTLEQQPRIDFVKVQKDMESICNRTENFFPSFEISFDAVHLEEQADLVQLLSRCLGTNISESSNATLELKSLAGIDLQYLMRSILAAAICEWVFEAEVKDLFFGLDQKLLSEEDCWLCERYRTALASQDEALSRNLNFAAHQSRIKEPFFENHVVPQKAKTLAKRASDVVSSLVTYLQMSKRSIEKIEQLLHSEDSCMLDIFTDALAIKCKLLVCTDLFEATFYSPGTTFTNTDMIPEYDIVIDQEKRADGKPIKLTLFPGMRQYQHDRKFVDYNSFARRGAVPVAEGTPLFRAVVLV